MRSLYSDQVWSARILFYKSGATDFRMSSLSFNGPRQRLLNTIKSQTLLRRTFLFFSPYQTSSLNARRKLHWLFFRIFLFIPQVSQSIFYVVPSQTPPWPKPLPPRRSPSPLSLKILQARHQSPRTPASTRTSSSSGPVARLQMFK